MSLLKYAQNQELVRGNGRGPLSFSRAHMDGVPYRGQRAMLREDEYEELTETVRDGYVELFDLSLPNHKSKLQEIVDAAANGWYQVHKMVEQFVPQPPDKDGYCGLKVFVYCVWVEPFRELAKHRIPQNMLQK